MIGADALNGAQFSSKGASWAVAINSEEIDGWDKHQKINYIIRRRRLA